MVFSVMVVDVDNVGRVWIDVRNEVDDVVRLLVGDAVLFLGRVRFRVLMGEWLARRDVPSRRRLYWWAMEDVRNLLVDRSIQGG